MEYERIERRFKHQGSGGGLSPGKLRNMLLGVDKRRKQQDREEDEEIESAFSSRSQVSEIDDSGGSSSENCKDVNVVSVLPDCSTFATSDPLIMEAASGGRPKDQSLASLRARCQDDGSIDYESGVDSVSISSIFEFQKAEKATHRLPMGPFSKPAPSKWDDAQKWIASPTANRQKNVQGMHGTGLRKSSNFGFISRQPSMKVVVEVPDQRLVPFEEPDTKRIDLSQTKKDNVARRLVSWEADAYPVDSFYKPALVTESFEESAINLSRHDSLVSIQSATTFIPPPSTARSVSMRDMGTEMTPIASQEPSRNGTPVRATTPMRSPNSSQPSTPQRLVPTSSPLDSHFDHLDPNKKELSEKELQMKTRNEILNLGTQLGKRNIVAWANKVEEGRGASTSLKSLKVEESTRSVIETRATAWEEAERAKYMARFKREEMKIQAWENHQKAKTEAEMRKIEVEVERMRGRAQDKLMNKLAATRHKAEEKRAVAETKRNCQAAKTEQQAEYIRRTGRVPSSFSCCGLCL